jgi:hypothetical protein
MRKVVGAVVGHLFITGDSSFEPLVLTRTSANGCETCSRGKLDNLIAIIRAMIKTMMKAKPEAPLDLGERRIVIEHFLKTHTSIFQNDPDSERSFMICPILSFDRAVFGIVLMQENQNAQKFSSDDLRLLESYTVFLAVCMERNKLKSVAQYGSSEINMQLWMTEAERTRSGIPKKLKLLSEEISKVLSQNFVASASPHFTVVFFLFEHFDIFRAFRILNETFFHFVYDLKESYNPVPYHNWIHAVDVTQFMAFQLGLLRDVFTKFEVLVLLAASVCHDANEDGFPNQYNVKAQAPLGILFRSQSILEVPHCSVSVWILTRDSCHI